MENVIGAVQVTELELTVLVMARERLMMSTQLRLNIMEISLGYSFDVQCFAPLTQMVDVLQIRWLAALGFTVTTNVTAPLVEARLVPPPAVLFRPGTVPKLKTTEPLAPTEGWVPATGLELK
jgi:hypothetical protein